MIGGSGGGFAHFYRTPSYQIGIPGINTFHARQYFSYSLLPINGTPPLLSGKDYGRNYPDISANMMGYQVYQQDGKIHGHFWWTALLLTFAELLPNDSLWHKRWIWNLRLSLANMVNSVLSH